MRRSPFDRSAALQKFLELNPVNVNGIVKLKTQDQVEISRYDLALLTFTLLSVYLTSGRGASGF